MSTKILTWEEFELREMGKQYKQIVTAGGTNV